MTVYQFPPNKTYANHKKFLFRLPCMMYKLDNHMICYMLIYSIVYVKSQIMKRWRHQKDTDLTLFREYKPLI